MVSPWLDSAPLDPAAFATIRLRTIFECFKWDPRLHDEEVLLPIPLVLERAAWREIACTAEALFGETLALERELAARPDLVRRLGIPRRLRRALARGHAAAPPQPRVMRFDFHATTEGWRVSEVNADVPGGYIEASGFAALVAEHDGRATPPGDPGRALALALAATIGPATTVALVHATAYADDAQVMRFLGAKLAAAGVRGLAVSPTHLRWRDGRPRIETDWCSTAVDAVLRFFPAEWLAALPSALARPYFDRARVPQTNPGTALLVQTKRVPLVWSELRTPVPVWRRVLPETLDPRAVPRAAAGWVLKPALGRVGEGVAIDGVSDPPIARRARRAAWLSPGTWVAQRRFEPLPWSTAVGPLYPCLGVFVIDGRAAGVYGRAARRALVDGRALDVAVLVEREHAGARSVA